MPRDGSGNYTLPPGNPVVGHETIEANWANTTMADVEAALTDSLSRNGNGGMLVPFRFSDGSVGAPGLTFANEPTTGFYRHGLNDVRWSVGAQDIIYLTPSGLTVAPGKSIIGALFSGVTVSSGNIDNTVIGGTTPAAGTFTSVRATGGVAPGVARSGAYLWGDANNGMLDLISSTASADGKCWQFSASNSGLTGGLVKDDMSTQNTWLAVQHSGNTVTEIDQARTIVLAHHASGGLQATQLNLALVNGFVREPVADKRKSTPPTALRLTPWGQACSTDARSSSSVGSGTSTPSRRIRAILIATRSRTRSSKSIWRFCPNRTIRFAPASIRTPPLVWRSRSITRALRAIRN